MDEATKRKISEGLKRFYRTGQRAGDKFEKGATEAYNKAKEVYKNAPATVAEVKSKLKEAKIAVDKRIDSRFDIPKKTVTHKLDQSKMLENIKQSQIDNKAKEMQQAADRAFISSQRRVFESAGVKPVKKDNPDYFRTSPDLSVRERITNTKNKGLYYIRRAFSK